MSRSEVQRTSGMYKWIKYPIIASVIVLTLLLIIARTNIVTDFVVLEQNLPPSRKYHEAQKRQSTPPSISYNYSQNDYVPMTTPTVPLEPVKPDDWKAKLPDYKVPDRIRQTDWWRAAAFLELDFRERSRDYKCKRLVLQGNWYVCLDGKWNIKKPCLVYSFGIAFDFSFDDDMVELGCEVHSFDPSMGLKDHIRNTSVHFHPIGIGGETVENFIPRQDMYVQNQQSWNIMTLGTIMAALGHKGRTIDLLKIDVEGHEWSIIEYLLNTGLLKKVKQFSLEYHLFPDWPPKSDYTKLLRIYKRLHDSGFRKFHTGIHPLNHDPDKFNIQADIGYVNFGYKNF